LFERTPRSFDCEIHVGRRSHSDTAGNAFVGGIDDVQAQLAKRIGPSPIDVKFQIMSH
jgi:hypothetical protein